MLPKTETLKFQEIRECLPLRKLMRITCFELCLLLLWAAAAFFSSHVFLWNALFFLFVKTPVIQVVLLCRNMLYCGAPSSSHPSLQLYSLWRLSELCSCGGRLGRRAFLFVVVAEVLSAIQACPQGHRLWLSGLMTVCVYIYIYLCLRKDWWYMKPVYSFIPLWGIVFSGSLSTGQQRYLH